MSKKIKAPRIAVASAQRGSRRSAVAPRKLARQSLAQPLAPGDPQATNTATAPGPNGDGNTILTDTFYQMGQEDQRVVVMQNAATIALPLQPLNGYPVYITADGGTATITGNIQGGTVVLAQGTIGIFTYSDESGLWSVLTGGSGSTGTNTPLARTRWIDGNTLVAPALQNGSTSAPFVSPAAWLNNTTVFPVQPASLDDANTLEVGLISPTATDVWPAGEVWTIPANRSVTLRAPAQGFTNNTGSHSVTNPQGPQGAVFSGVTMAWANTPPVNPAHTPVSATLVLDNLAMAAFVATVSDAAGSAPSGFAFTGPNGSYSGSLNLTNATQFGSLLINTANTVLTGVTNPLSGPTFVTNIVGGNLTTTGLSTLSVTSIGGTYRDTATLTTTQGQTYVNSTVGAVKLKDTGAGQTISFTNCKFSQPTVVATSGGKVVFDGESWSAFQTAGGTISNETGGSVVTVAGGFMAGQVVGNGIFNPAGAAVSLAINGVGATATWTGGGNYYVVQGLIAPTTLTLLDTATAGAVNGTTLMISNRDTSGNALTVSDASGPTVLCVIPGNSFAVFISNGVNWTVLMQGSGLNQGNTIPVTHAAPLATLPPNFNALVDTSTGTISTITLGVGAFGDTFRVTDEGNDASTNNITVAPSSGAQLEDPNNPGVYQAANTTSVFATNGQTTTWQSNGAGKYKIIATGT